MELFAYWDSRDGLAEMDSWSHKCCYSCNFSVFFSGFGWKHWAAPETDSNHLCVCAFLLFDQKDDNISQIWIFGQILFCLFQYLLRTTLCEIPSNCLIYSTYTKILLEPVHNSHVRPNNKKKLIIYWIYCYTNICRNVSYPVGNWLKFYSAHFSR